MKKRWTWFFVSLVWVVFSASCAKWFPNPDKELDQKLSAPALPDVPFDYEGKHQVNNNYATLGRVLFYDPRLSANNSVSCGSCHLQGNAFASGKQFDKGANGQFLARNSQSIQGVKGFKPLPDKSFIPSYENQVKTTLFWDGRQSNLANMVLNPVLNHREMNMPDFATLTQKLSGTTYYPKLFEKAFGSMEITSDRIAFALESFIQCLDPLPGFSAASGFTGLHAITSGSLPASTSLPIDTSTFSQEEKYGRFLFHSVYNCAKCHDPSHGGGYGVGASENLPADLIFEPGVSLPAGALMFNIGLDADTRDAGLGGLTGRTADMGVFKVPTLLNVAFTAPYMHDGRFATLSEVLDHYSSGINLHPQLSSEFRNADGSVKNLNISASQKKALIAFLCRLSTPDFLHNPMYSDPFIKP